MAKAEVKTESRIKTKKKSWFKVLAGKPFEGREIGESYLTNPESATGRVIKANLKDLTGNIKDQNAYLIYRVEQGAGANLQTKLRGYEVNLASIKRLVRKNTDRLDDFLLAKTKDGETVMIKMVLITTHKTDRSVQAKIRAQLCTFFQAEMQKMDLASFITDLVEGKVKAALRKKVDKVYPVREMVVRVLKIVQRQAPVIEIIPEPEPVSGPESLPEPEAA